ncbi:MAG: hypothetical protein ACD_78C00439G0009 [uncultured bacterium (gcode 4)]|uniref:Uncharacterized protein n=1 Tax=uncultured bacterium (gcode 4) TaxID=1234023 RepID=K1XWM2_9BACT|nr:MAG: hypothetical protein ACD_78C00439G0009 [uncultured bacterium (gcode 4)]
MIFDGDEILKIEQIFIEIHCICDLEIWKKLFYLRHFYIFLFSVLCFHCFINKDKWLWFFWRV